MSAHRLRSNSQTQIVTPLHQLRILQHMRAKEIATRCFFAISCSRPRLKLDTMLVEYAPKFLLHSLSSVAKTASLCEGSRDQNLKYNE